jgi:Zn-dependent membrane protease YugP
MKPAIILIALLAGAFALPWFTAQMMRRGWKRWQGVQSQSNYSGASLAAIILRRSEIKGVGVIADGTLFYDHYDPHAKDIVLSPQVYRGHSIAALAHGALQAGHVLQHKENDKSYTRLIGWSRMLKILVNALPVLSILIICTPGGIRAIPALVIFFFIIAAIQVATFPSVRAAAEKGKQVVLENNLLPPEEIRDFQSALKSAAERHLAAPLLDCFWLRWLV